MTPLIFNLGPMELVIILVIVLLLFGGSRLAGLGKSTGRALKEFKEETKGLKEDPDAPQGQVGGGAAAPQPQATQPQATQPQATQSDVTNDEVRRDL